jgi:hypothetical protein
MEWVIENQTLLLAVAILLALFWFIRIEHRLKKILVGRNAESLEDSIVNIRKRVENLSAFKQISEDRLIQLDHRIKRAIGSVNTVRFNPFKGTGSGGNQSFATSFVSESGDGVVISSLYSRERTSVFAKPITHWESSYDLTSEEKQAINSTRANMSA